MTTVVFSLYYMQIASNFVPARTQRLLQKPNRLIFFLVNLPDLGVRL